METVNKTCGRLHFCMGLPRSGKSTYCDEWVRETFLMQFMALPAELLGYSHKELVTAEMLRCEDPVKMYSAKVPRVVIGGDDFRRGLHGKEFVPEAEGQVFAAMDIAIRALLRRGYDVIVDETATSEATIRRYFRIDINAIPHFIDTSVEECERRALKDGRHYLIGPIRRMAGQLATLKTNWLTIAHRIRKELDARRCDDVTV